MVEQDFSIKEKGIPPVNIEDYPAVKRHLDSFYPVLEKRSDKGDTPYHLRNCAYLDDFIRPKIVWIELTDHPNFALDQNSYFINIFTFFNIIL